MELRTEVEIDAPPDRVWEVLTGFADYASWNPLISSIAGPLAVDARLDVRLTLGDGTELRQRPTVVRVEPGRELRWRASRWVGGLFDGEHFFKLEPLDGGRTRFVHGENFTGILVKMMNRSLTLTARGFVGMNQALKRRVESEVRA